MHFRVKIDRCLSIVVKKVNRKKNSGDDIGMILTARRRMVQILTVSRKSHHPIDTL